MPSGPQQPPAWGAGFDDEAGEAVPPPAPVADEAVAAYAPDETIDPAGSQPAEAYQEPVVSPAPRSGTGPAAEVQPVETSPGAAPVAPAPAVAADPADDWLGKICPYLLSEDGTYRSTQPDEGHRCTAQEPNGTLPLAFQERFCLGDRHVRCEMYKYAQQARAAALDEGGVDRQQVQSARFKPAVRSTPVAISGTGAASTGAGGDAGSRRPLMIGAAALGGLIVIVLLTLLLSGGGDDASPGAGDADTSPAADGTPLPAATDEAAEPTPAPTQDAEATPDGNATGGSGEPAGAERRLLIYEVQEGEALLKIAENLGTTRKRILEANEGMADSKPYVKVGDLILVPASGELTIEELEAFPGYQGPAG